MFLLQCLRHIIHRSPIDNAFVKHSTLLKVCFVHYLKVERRLGFVCRVPFFTPFTSQKTCAIPLLLIFHQFVNGTKKYGILNAHKT